MLLARANGETVVSATMCPRLSVHTCTELKINQVQTFTVFIHYVLLIYIFFVYYCLSARETFGAFTEEHFCMYLKRASLPEEEFAKHKEAIRELLSESSLK